MVTQVNNNKNGKQTGSQRKIKMHQRFQCSKVTQINQTLVAIQGKKVEAKGLGLCFGKEMEKAVSVMCDREIVEQEK